MGDEFQLRLRIGKFAAPPQFFPLEPEQIENAAPQNVTPTQEGCELHLQKLNHLLKPISHGQQGYVTAQQENEYMKRMNAAPTAALLDPQGDLGRLYFAKTTPHMFIINPDGVLVYDGAIDSKATTDQRDIATATNYVSQGLEEAMAGNSVSTPTSRPYGCSVKYAH